MRRRKIIVRVLVGVVAILGTLLGIQLWMSWGRDMQNAPYLNPAELPDVRLLTKDEWWNDRNHKPVIVPVKNIPKQLINAFITAEEPDFFKRSASYWKLSSGVKRYISICSSLAGTFYLQKNEREEFFISCLQPIAGIQLIFSKRGSSFSSKKYTLELFLARVLAARSERRNNIRRIKERMLAEVIEETFSKEKILNIYLNRVFLGRGSFGVASAAHSYFNKSPKDLTLEELAYLAALPKGPVNYHPIRHAEKAIKRRNWVLDRMVEEGYVSQQEAEAAKARPLGFNPPPAPHK
jgi:membrane peptidoglycan carboxypeptidase